MPIPPGLIVYSPKRYYVNMRVSTKHGLVTRKLFFKKKGGLRKNKEFQCIKASSRQIRDLNYSLANTKREKNMFLKFTSYLIMLRKLSLTFETSSSGAKLNISFLKKLFSQNKRISSVTVVLCKRGKDSTFVLTPLCLLRKLKYLELRMQFHSESMVEKLSQFLWYMYRRQNWPALKGQTISLDVGFTGLSLDNDVMNTSQTLANLSRVTSQKPTNLHLLFYFRRNPNVPALETLSEALRSMSDIVALSLISQVSTDFSHLLKAMQDSKRLKDVTTYICDDQQTSQTLMVLPESLGNIKTLNNLKLHFLDIGEVAQFNYFAVHLNVFTQLATLSLTFFRTGLINDNSFVLLGTSLAALVNLRDLHINCKKQSRTTNIGSDGIESVFGAISGLTKLKSLTLNFSGYGSSVSEKTVDPLFKSLGFLVNLQYLSLNLSLNRIGDDGINCLRKVIPNLKKMKSLILEFEQCVWLSSKAIAKFAISLKQLRNLSFLTIKFMSAMVDIPLALTLAGVLHSLRSLRALEVRLYRWNDIYDDGLATLLEAVKHLEGRVRLDFKCPLLVLLSRTL